MDFQQAQKQFSEHIRHPERNAKPADIEMRRMKIYQDLFFNNINGFLQSGFPVLRTLYSEQHWLTLVRSFFSSHQCESPYFLDISKEFVHYLASEYENTPADPPFLQELAHYEWVELAVSTALDTRQQHAVQDFHTQTLYFSEFAQVLSYHYPVHTISVEHQPQEPGAQPTYLCVYRDAEDEVKFMALNGMTALLLSTLAEHQGLTLEQLCRELHQQAPQFSMQQLEQGAAQLLSDLCQKQIVVTLDSHT